MTLDEYSVIFVQATKNIFPNLELLLSKRELQNPGAFLAVRNECERALQQGKFANYEPIDQFVWDTIASPIRIFLDSELECDRLHLLLEIWHWINGQIYTRWNVKFEAVALRHKTGPLAA